MNDVVKVLIRALKDTFLEPVGTALERSVGDGKYVIREGADLADLVTKHAQVAFPGALDQPERDLAAAIGAAFGAYMDAKTAQAKAAADAQAKLDAEAPNRAAAEAKKKADAARLFADNAKKNAEDLFKKAATDAELAAARDAQAAVDQAESAALQAKMDSDLAAATVTNAAKYAKAPNPSGTATTAAKPS